MEGTQPSMRPKSPGGEGMHEFDDANDAKAFAGATPLEDWLRREERHERFLREGGGVT